MLCVTKHEILLLGEIDMETYDLFLSIGPACRPASYLSSNHLRQFASPLDWQMSYSLDTVIQLFKTSFSSFFCDISEDTRPGADNNRRVIDKTNNIISIHHFDKNIPLEDCQKEFISKMHRRYVNLHSKLKASSSLMLLCNRKADIKELENFLLDFSGLYENLHITLMNIRNDCTMNNTDIYTRKYNISDKLKIIEHIFNDSIDCKTGEKYSWRGNEALWNFILRDYCIPDSKDIENTIKKLYERLQGNNIVIYGAGVMCSILITELSKYNIKAKGIAVSNAEENPSEYKGLPVSTIENYSSDDVILIAILNPHTSLAIKNSLLSKGYNKIVEFDFAGGIIPNVENIHKE